MIKCFCVTGLMSKCTATDVEEQKSCFFSEKASFASRCKHRNEMVGNHCDCLEAQVFARSGKIINNREEEELNIDDFIEEEDPLELVTSCATCDKLDSNFSPTCKMWDQLEDNEMRDLAIRCPGFDLVASCVICKHHDACHDGTSGDNYGLPDKISIANTCKKYDPITNNPGKDDNLPF